MYHRVVGFDHQTAQLTNIRRTRADRDRDVDDASIGLGDIDGMLDLVQQLDGSWGIVTKRVVEEGEVLEVLRQSCWAREWPKIAAAKGLDLCTATTVEADPRARGYFFNEATSILPFTYANTNNYRCNAKARLTSNGTAVLFATQVIKMNEPIIRSFPVKHRNSRCANRFYAMTLPRIADMTLNTRSSRKNGWCQHCADRCDLDTEATADPDFNYKLPTTTKDIEFLWRLEAQRKLSELVETIDVTELMF